MRRCCQCRNYFKEEDLLLITPTQVFCSKECVSKKTFKQRADRIAKSNSKKIPSKIEKEVRSRDRNKCRACETKHKRSWPVSPHHIMYRSEGGQHTVDNLILLCPGCHDKVHSDKDYQRVILRQKDRAVIDLTILDEDKR